MWQLIHYTEVRFVALLIILIITLSHGQTLTEFQAATGTTNLAANYPPIFYAGLVAVVLFALRTVAQGPYAACHQRLSTNQQRKLQDREKYGQSAIVTGANAGCGFETAKQLAGFGFRVIMLCRSPENAREAKNSILKTDPEADVEICIGDVSDLKSLKQVAKEAVRLATSAANNNNNNNNKNKQKQVLSQLVNNAGFFSPSIQLSDKYSIKEGGEAALELMWLTNYLGPYLLTEYIVPQMIISCSEASLNEQTQIIPRLVNVSSVAHMWAITPLNFTANDTKKENHSSAMLHFIEKQASINTYGISKLANILHAKMIDRRYNSKTSNDNTKSSKSKQNSAGVVIHTCSLHPGSVHSNIWRWVPPKAKPVVDAVMSVMFKSCEAGAQTTLHCCMTPSLVGTTKEGGAYFTDCQEVPPSSYASDENEMSAVEEYTRNFLKEYL